MPVGNRANSGGVVTSPITVASFVVTEISPLYVFIVHQGAGTPLTVSSVTWNGSENFTLVARKSDSVTQNTVDLYELKNPTATTANVVVTLSANPVNGAYVAVIGTTGMATDTAHRTVYTRNDTDGTGPGTTVVDSVNNDLVLHAAQGNATTITFDGGEDTTSTEADNISGSGFSGGLSTKAATGASTVVGCTDVEVYSEVAIAVIPAAQGASPALPWLPVTQVMRGSSVRVVASGFTPGVGVE